MLYQDKNIYEHKHLMSDYYLHCLDEKYSKKVQLFDKLEEFRDNLINELDYIENINENVLNYEIDMSTFDQKEFDNVNICNYCSHNFENKFNRRQITLTEKVDKYKLKRIIDDFENNNINQKTQNNLKQCYNNLNKDGEIDIIHKQSNNTGRYYSNKFSLQNMFNEVRSSIIHKDCIDVDFKNSIVTIIMYLADKHNLEIPNIIKYSKDRENILNNINKDRINNVRNGDSIYIYGVLDANKTGLNYDMPSVKFNEPYLLIDNVRFENTIPNDISANKSLKSESMYSNNFIINYNDYINYYKIYFWNISRQIKDDNANKFINILTGMETTSCEVYVVFMTFASITLKYS